MDTAPILRTAALGAPRRAWGAVLGIQSGTLGWGVLTSAGVTALVTASHLAYEGLRWAGACYLIWTGLNTVWGARHCPVVQPIDEPVAVGNGFFLGRRRGVLTNLLNPKMGAFHVVLARRRRRVLQRPSVRQLLERVTGTVITGFGIRLATSGH